MTAPEGVLRVVTLNIWNRNQWLDRRDEIVSWIDYLQPDAVGLQEVSRTDADCQAEWLGEHTGRHVSLGGVPRPDGTVFGNAVLSRHPILETEQHLLPALGRRDEGRLCLRATLDTGRGPIQFYATHLNCLFDHGFVREAQVAELSRFIDATRLPNCPPIVVGDFNAVPDSTEIRYLKCMATLGGRSFHLFDAYAVANPGAPGRTWDNRNPYAVTNRVPDQRIDYIFVGVRTEDGTGQVLRSDVVCGRPLGRFWQSDHFGVLADIAFPAR